MESFANMCETTFIVWKIGHVNEYPTMHYFGNPRHIPSTLA